MYVVDCMILVGGGNMPCQINQEFVQIHFVAHSRRKITQILRYSTTFLNILISTGYSTISMACSINLVPSCFSRQCIQTIFVITPLNQVHNLTRVTVTITKLSWTLSCGRWHRKMGRRYRMLQIFTKYDPYRNSIRKTA